MCTKILFMEEAVNLLKLFFSQFVMAIYAVFIAENISKMDQVRNVCTTVSWDVWSVRYVAIRCNGLRKVYIIFKGLDVITMKHHQARIGFNLSYFQSVHAQHSNQKKEQNKKGENSEEEEEEKTNDEHCPNRTALLAR